MATEEMCDSYRGEKTEKALNPTSILLVLIKFCFHHFLYPHRLPYKMLPTLTTDPSHAVRTSLVEDHDQIGRNKFIYLVYIYIYI